MNAVRSLTVAGLGAEVLAFSSPHRNATGPLRTEYGLSRSAVLNFSCISFDY